MRRKPKIEVLTYAAALYCVAVLSLGARSDLNAKPHLHRARVRITVEPNKTGRAIAPDFLGFSYEAPDLTRDYFDVQNADFVRLLSGVGVGTLRFGGNSVEFTGWSRSGSRAEAGERAAVTPADLNRLFAFSQETGWRVILGLNLGHYDPSDFADEAAYAVAHGAPQLLALEIGNEPDLFMHNGQRASTWGYENFRREFEAYVSAIRARTPRAPISGPATCCSEGFRWFPHFLADEESELVFASHHIYPMSAAPNVLPSSPHYASIDHMLSPELMAGVAKEVSELSAAAHSNHLPLRIAETNSASHGGKDGVSNVFAAALWGADYAFTLAENGADGLNFHGGFACRGYTAICIQDGTYHAQPLYYGMLLFHAATPGQIVPVKLQGSANVAVHAVLAGDGALTLVLINKSENLAASVSVHGAGSYTRATIFRLTAPALDASSGVTFGGSAVAGDGSWQPGTSELAKPKRRAFRVDLPAASALIARFEK